MAAAKDGRFKYRAPALEKGLDILEILAASRLPLSQGELSLKLGRSHGEFFRMLTCLEDRGYVIREAGSGHFKLTLRLYELGHKQHAATMLRNAVRVPMEELTEEIGQACHLSVQSGSSVLILVERMPSRKICLAVGEGTTFPLIETTSGKLLLSRLPTPEVSGFLATDPVFQGKSQAERKGILHAIQALRENGYVVAKSDVTEGVTDIATLVGVPGTDTEAVLVVPYLAGAHQKKQNHKQYVVAIGACAATINSNLGILASVRGDKPRGPVPGVE